MSRRPRFVSRARALLGAALLSWLINPPARAAEVVADFGAAILESWTAPAYPEAARRAKHEGRVLVDFVVEADGSVTRAAVAESAGADFDAAALGAVQQWHFRPALEEGRPAASAMRAPVVFSLERARAKKPPLMPPENELPRPLPVEPAAARGGLDPDYPDELNARKLPGEVRIQFIVDATGRARDPKVLWASNPAFVESALATLARAEFSPAHQGPLPRSSPLEYPVAFEIFGARLPDILAANHLEVVTGDRVPAPWMMLAPVLPRKRLLAGDGGTAVAEFAVNTEGVAEEIAITQSAGDDCDAALVAAIETWIFRPARGQQPEKARLRFTHTFSAAELPAEQRIAELLAPGGAGVAGPAGLDRKLRPLWRGFPVYPRTLLADRPSGRAVIEFVIDRGGRARAIKVIEATAPAFGAAAAAAITQWVFEAPLRNGQPDDVLVRIPVEFQPPKS